MRNKKISFGVGLVGRAADSSGLPNSVCKYDVQEKVQCEADPFDSSRFYAEIKRVHPRASITVFVPVTGETNQAGSAADVCIFDSEEGERAPKSGCRDGAVLTSRWRNRAVNDEWCRRVV